MLIPTGHENLEGRRWPWVTIAIIVLNFLAFGFTHGRMEDEAMKIYQTKIRMVMLEAYHPYVAKSPAAVEMIERFKASQPKLWEHIQRPDRPIEGIWDIEMREYEQPQADAEMARLTAEMEQNEKDSFVEKYAFFSYKRTPLSYITAAFLHAGWFHIIFNMWFLWLAGTVLEDAWGRIVYPIFYLLAGAIAFHIQALASPGSMAAGIGASGAVAGLMGAFLVRYFKTKINFVLFYVLGLLPRFFRFKAPAYVMLPLWLASQLASASLAGEFGDGGVAYWAHIAGFVFGTVVALGLKFSGVEKKVDQAIEGKVGWSADPRVVEAGEIIVAKPDRAIELLTPVVAEQPGLIEAWGLLERAYWQKQDFENYRTALVTLARLHLKQKDFDAALQNFEDFASSGGEKFPPAEWMQLIRWFESQQNWERAAAEYENYAKAHPTDRMAVYSLVSAARIHLKNLNNKTEAARLYHAAEASPVPHLDWDDAIKRGLREATA